MSFPAPMSFKVAATLSAYRAVACVTGTAYTVQYPVTNQNLPIGITVDTVKDTTASIPVARAGSIAKLYFNDTCGSGECVGVDSSGRGIKHLLADTTTALTLASAYLGILVGPSVALTGTIADVLIMPGYDRE